MTEPTSPPLPGHGHSPKARNLAAQKAAERRGQRLRAVTFGVIAVLVLVVGGYLATSDLLGQRGSTSIADAITMRSSMAGFDPTVLEARPGETLTIDWWNTDNATHLDGGVHSFIVPELGISETLPAESRRTLSITAPTTPGEYDFYCETCCGGKESPTMHGTLVVTA
jgi:cytochrome c oxidase subunit 2